MTQYLRVHTRCGSEVPRDYPIRNKYKSTTVDRRPVHNRCNRIEGERISIRRMLKLTLLVALLGAICVVHGASLAGTRTADMDFLHKQKKIFDLLLYVKQTDLSDAEWYDIGRNYNVESNIDMYRDKVILQDVLCVRGKFEDAKSFFLVV